MELNNYGVLLGILAKDMELLTNSTTAKVRIMLAVEREYMNQEKKSLAEQEGKPTSDFPHGLVAYGENALRWMKWYGKGDLLHVFYTVRTWKFEDENGKMRYMEEKVISKIRCRRKKAHGDAEHSGKNTEQSSYKRKPANSDQKADYGNLQYQGFDHINGDDDIPF